MSRPLETPAMAPITTQNWLLPPFNRASFQRVAELFPTATLRRGNGPFTSLPSVADPPGAAERVLGFTYTGIDGSERTIAQMLRDNYTDAFLVLQRGKVLLEHYENGMKADTLHLMNSCTKTWVGMLAGILAAEGVVDPAQKVSHYLPELAHGALRETTLQQALDMTAGVVYEEEYASGGPLDEGGEN
jgi:CubicO group peptidase (beta-lactamase class C family)